MKSIFAAVLIAVGLVSGAQAATVAGSVQAKWTGENGSFLSYTSGDSLYWGIPASEMYLNDGGFSDDVSVGMNHVSVMSIEWSNASSLGWATPDKFSAYADIAVNFTVPGAGGGSESVKFKINNTDNPLGDTTKLSVLTGPADFGAPFQLDANTTVLGFSLVHSGAGFYNNGLWYNPEHKDSKLTLVAKIAVVPLPAAGWLLIAGIGGLAAMRARRKVA